MHFSVTLQRTRLEPRDRLVVSHCEGCTTLDTGHDSTTILLPGNADPRSVGLQFHGADAAAIVDFASMEIPSPGLIVVDHRSGVCRVVTPRIGIASVFWQATADHLFVSSSPVAFHDGRQAAPPIDPQALYDYVYFHMLPAPGSIYAGVAKLCGGNCLTWQEGRASVERYWLPRFGRRRAGSEASAAGELRDLLGAAVQRSLGRSPAAGAFLSGGLDSSTVAGYAARLRPGIPTVSIGFDAAGYDEMEYARIASGHFGTRALEYYVTPDDVLRTLPEIASSFAEPFGNSSAAAVFHCARLAREQGLDLLLAGDGGDELFGGNERYAKQLVFERYASLPLAFRKHLLEPAVAGAARVTRAFPIGKALSYIEQAAIPLPDRLQHYNFLHRHAPSEVFTPAVLASVDTGSPLRQLQAEYAAPSADSPVDRMLFTDWKFTLHDNDLVKVNTMCALAGIEVAYPMLDPTLVDFSMQLPEHWKVRHGELRVFYKRAMRGFLPGRILRKTKHGFGLPFGVWMRTHEGLRRLAADSLASLGIRGYFRTDFLRDALRMHRDDHASFYGELVWILTVLELWLQRHAPDARL